MILTFAANGIHNSIAREFEKTLKIVAFVRAEYDIFGYLAGISDNYAVVSANPASGFFEIFTEEGSLVKVDNMTGILITKGSVTGNSLRIDTSGLHSGVYFIKVSTGNKNFTQKITIQ